MFRKMRRINREISFEDTKALLEKEKRGVLSVNGDDGYPFTFPINFLYAEEEGKIYFHGAKEGHKVDSLEKNDKVCFTVYGNEHFKEGEWAPYVQSAVVFGRCRLIDDKEMKVAKIRLLAEKYYPNKEEIETEMVSVDRALLYEITIEHMTGKQIKER